MRLIRRCEERDRKRQRDIQVALNKLEIRFAVEIVKSDIDEIESYDARVFPGRRCMKSPVTFATAQVQNSLRMVFTIIMKAGATVRV